MSGLTTPASPSVPAPRPAPHTDLHFLSVTLDHLSSAAWVLRDGDRDAARHLIDGLASAPAARAFPAGSVESLALAVILRVLRGAS